MSPLQSASYEAIELKNRTIIDTLKTLFDEGLLKKKKISPYNQDKWSVIHMAATWHLDMTDDDARHFMDKLGV